MAENNCPVVSIDSDSTSLSFAEETCPKQLPANPIWYGAEPNSYSDFGPSFTSTARSAINRNRQQQKGSITGVEVPAGWNTDVTDGNFERLAQGFLLANVEEQPTTKPLNGASVATLVSSDNTTGLVFDKTVAALFAKGDIIALKSAPASASKLGLSVTEVSADGLTVSVVGGGTFAGDASTEVCKVGFSVVAYTIQDDGDKEAVLSVTDEDFDFTKHSLSLGMWLAVASPDLLKVGYGRISKIEKAELSFDDWSFPKGSLSGLTGLNVYVPNIIRNAIDPDNIITRTYCLERRLGSAGLHEQAEYINGAMPSTLTMTLPESGKIACDLVFAGLNATYRDGLTDANRPFSDTQTFIAAPSDNAAFTTATDVVATRLTLKGMYDGTSPGAANLFKFISAASISLNNTISANTAIGTLGAISQNKGKLVVGGSITAYFASVAALQAARDNRTAALTVIAANDDGGFIIDIPSLTVSGARVTVASGAPVNLPLTPSGFEDEKGYTMAYMRFKYVPKMQD